MRTLFETSADEIWLSEHGVNIVLKAASRTTAENPFLQVKNKRDMAFLYRAVLNVLSERFAEAYVAQTLGLPVKTEDYCFLLSYARYRNMRTYKLRVLIVKESDLQSTFAPGSSPIKLVDGVYETRMRTLRLFVEAYNQETEPGALPIGRVVLGLPLLLPAEDQRGSSPSREEN